MTESEKNILLALQKALFNKQPSMDITADDIDYNEAQKQAVTTLVYSAIDDSHWEISAQTLKRNMIVLNEHSVFHKLMCDAEIPYVVLKGYASAYYYSKPLLRVMGDVDVLVAEDSLEQTGILLEKAGYKPAESSKHESHIAYHKGNLTIEVHWQMTGIPEGKSGDRVRWYMADAIETAVLSETQYGQFMIPDEKHHCLILLLHTASHLLNTGIGVRHLCDWACFVNRVDGFEEHFGSMLRDCGLWNFARLLTIVSTRYIGLPKQKWAGEADESLIEAIMEDPVCQNRCQ